MCQHSWLLCTSYEDLQHGIACEDLGRGASPGFFLLSLHSTRKTVVSARNIILQNYCVYIFLYSDTSANEDNSFRNHIRQPKSSLAETSRCLDRKQPSRVGVSPLCDVVSSFLCHTHTDGKDKLLEWPDRSCLLLYVSARIH